MLLRRQRLQNPDARRGRGDRGSKILLIEENEATENHDRAPTTGADNSTDKDRRTTSQAAHTMRQPPAIQQPTPDHSKPYRNMPSTQSSSTVPFVRRIGSEQSTFIWRAWAHEQQ